MEQEVELKGRVLGHGKLVQLWGVLGVGDQVQVFLGHGELVQLSLGHGELVQLSGVQGGRTQSRAW